MSAHWDYHDADGGDAGRSEAYDSRQEAEDWLGAQWRDLLDRGVMEVTLVDDGQVAYRMKLTAE